ncbi:MAG: hypothetical protein EPO07_05740, partial [Verrucomicrobia bacterium]
MNTPPDTLYEYTALRTRQRRYTKGFNLWHTTGVHWDGDREDFLGQSLRSKYSVGGHPPHDPCGNVRHIQAGIFLGATMPRDDQPGFFLQAGVLLGDALVPYPPEP